MTRLTSQDIAPLADRLKDHDRYLTRVTGYSLLGIGVAAAGIEDIFRAQELAPRINTAVVPIRSGLGIISGFTETVCSILVHLGFDGWVTRHTDVAGFTEAVDHGAQVIFASDDDCFAAFCPQQGKTVYNSHATAHGFVAGLDLMAGGLDGRKVLVLGCGPVGQRAVQALLMRNARIGVVDRVGVKAVELAGWAGKAYGASVNAIADVEAALLSHDLLVDATNAPDVIRTKHVTPRTYVTAPGVPCGITAKAMQKLNGRILHDPLQIGVSTMACESIRIVHADI